MTESDVCQEKRPGKGGGDPRFGTCCRGRAVRLHDVHGSLPGGYREDLLPSGEREKADEL